MNEKGFINSFHVCQKSQNCCSRCSHNVKRRNKRATKGLRNMMNAWLPLIDGVFFSFICADLAVPVNCRAADEGTTMENSREILDTFRANSDENFSSNFFLINTNVECKRRTKQISSTSLSQKRGQLS